MEKIDAVIFFDSRISENGYIRISIKIEICNFDVVGVFVFKLKIDDPFFFEITESWPMVVSIVSPFHVKTVCLAFAAKIKNAKENNSNLKNERDRGLCLGAFDSSNSHKTFRNALSRFIEHSIKLQETIS